MENLQVDEHLKGFEGVAWWRAWKLLPFLHALPTLVISYDSHSDKCEAISHCGFALHSLLLNDVGHLFMYLLVFCISFFFGKLPIQFLHTLLIGLVFVVIVATEMCEFLYVLN